MHPPSRRTQVLPSMGHQVLSDCKLDFLLQPSNSAAPRAMVKPVVQPSRKLLPLLNEHSARCPVTTTQMLGDPEPHAPLLHLAPTSIYHAHRRHLQFQQSFHFAAQSGKAHIKRAQGQSLAQVSGIINAIAQFIGRQHKTLPADDGS